MAFTFIASASNYAANSGTATISVSKPTGTADGDIMFALYTNRSGNNPSSVPSGRTELATKDTASGGETRIYYKIAASEGASYTRGGGAFTKRRVTISTYRGGFDSVDPIDVISNTLYSTNNTTLRAASMTTSAANEGVVFIGLHDGNTTLTPPSGRTENYDNYESNTGIGHYISNTTMVSAGATGVVDATAESNIGSKHAYMVALNPEITTSIKTINGLAKASVKTINGLAVGSVKNINGLA